VKGKWQKADVASPPRVVAADGSTIALTPGRSWIELPVPGLADLRS
jgi:hypothetical protein